MNQQTKRKAAGLLAVITGLGTWGVPALGFAASRDVLHDVRSQLDSLRQSREEIRYYHQAQADVKRARVDLEQARAGLAEAQKGRREAAVNLGQVLANLNAVKKALAETEAALQKAQAESAKRTHAALAAQRAVVQFTPAVQAAQADRDAKEAAAKEREAAYEAKEKAVENRDTEALRAEDAQKEALVKQALTAVNYEQNRLLDAEDMVNDALDKLNGQENAAEQEAQAELDRLAQQMDAASEALDAADQRLDALQQQLDALTDAREQAEDAERDAREQVRDYQQQAVELTVEKQQAEKDEAEAQAYDSEAAKWLDDAENWARSALKERQRADYALAHFGEGAGWQTGVEFDSWKGRESGHQLFIPLNFYQAGRISGHRVDIGLSTGYVQSDTHKSHGSVSGWADTQLSAELRNDHKQNSVRYQLLFNLPTGQSAIYQNAVVGNDLARMTDFGAGFQVTPGLELIHHFTERDSLAASVQYTLRRSYDYSKEVPGAQVDPGNAFQQEVSYLHAGPKTQYRLGVVHSHAESSYQDTIFSELREVEVPRTLHNGKGGPQGGEGGTQTVTREFWGRDSRLHYREGDDWELSWFYNDQITKRDELSLYGIWNLVSAGWGYRNQAVHRLSAGAGWLHHMNERQEWHILAGYKDVTSNWDPLRLELNSGAYKYYSLLLGFSWQLGAKNRLSLDGERFRRKDDRGGSYRGWKVLCTLNQSF